MSWNRTILERLRHPLIWVLLYGGLIVSGFIALDRISVEVLPQFHFPQISVVARQQGATAEEMENLIARPLESQVMTLPGVASVRSSMGAGTVQIDIRFVEGSVAQEDLQAVRTALDRARAVLPAGVDPHAEIMGNAINEVADYGLKLDGSVSPMQAQRDVMTRILPALRAIPGVQRVDVSGAGHEALWIQPNLIDLQKYGISVQAIAQVVRNQVVLGPDGYLTLGHQDVVIEARHLPVKVAQLGKALVPGPNGDIPLAQLARIVHAPEPTHNAVSLDGLPSVILTVFKQPTASTLPVTRTVDRVLQQTSDVLPDGAAWTRLYSQGYLVGLIGSDLGRNLLIGGLLAVGVLFWVLGASRGVWILALAIPLSLLVAVDGLYWSGHSLNLLTLGALTIAVGLVVDDAIIVFESIYQRWEAGMVGWQAAWDGLRGIASPDITGTLTVVAVFVPLLFVGGLAGLFSAPFGLAMALVLLASLLVSLTVIPLLMGSMKPRLVRDGSGARFVSRLRQLNERIFHLALKWPRSSLAVCGLLLVISFAGMALVPMNFLPLPNEGVLLESFALPPGTSLDQTEKVVGSMTGRLMKNPVVAHVYARIGSASSTFYTESSSAGELMIALKPTVQSRSLDEISRELLKATRTTGVQVAIDTPTVERLGESLSGLPQPFVLRIFGPDMSTLRQLADRITKRLRRVVALSDVFDNDGYPITQLRLQPRTAALQAHDLTPGGLQKQLGLLLGGKVLATVPDHDHRLDMYVRLQDVRNLDLNELKALPIQTPNGWVPLRALADLHLVTRANLIRHLDGARELDIVAFPTAPLSTAVREARQALASVALPKGYRLDFGGLLPQLEHAGLVLLLAAAAAFLIMVVILMFQFNGLLVPGLLLLQIPLAFTGGAMALVVSGVGLNALGLVAFLTLIGIGLNHGIVLLHRARRNEAAGMNVQAAVSDAVQVRFRPILLTTMTAVLGMLPTAMGWGKGAAPEQGLALVIMGGIVWSALLSTNLIPALYVHWRKVD